MFAWWGRTVFKYRFIVIAVMVSLCIGGGIFGMSLGNHVTQSGFYDDGSESVKASVLADDVYGRDRLSHVVAILDAPEGKKVNDPAWAKKMAEELDQVQEDNPDQVLQWAGYLKDPTADPDKSGFNAEDSTRTFIIMPLKGDNDDEILNNYKDHVKEDLEQVNDGNIELAGLQPLANELTGTIAEDQKRAEVLALPLVAVVLFFVFGGVIAAFLPAMVGGLAIAGSMGILMLVAQFGPVHYFAQPVVTLIGLGIAIDYGLFVVSRFREELAEGYQTEAAVRRTMMTAGRTVVFSAVLIVASLAGLLLFPQGFLKSLTYAGMSSIMLAAILSVTVLPAVLAILGPNVDAFGVRTLLRVPFLRNWGFSRAIIEWLAEKTQKTKTREEVEKGFWGKLANRVMKRPLVFAVPIIVIMVLLITPLGNLALGGISEKYLPPNNPVRMAQEDFDRTFPGFRTEQLTLVIENATPEQIDQIASRAAQIPGFSADEWTERAVAPDPDNPNATAEKTRDDVTVLQNGLEVRNDAAKKMEELRAIPLPQGVSLSVGGVPALEQDSISSLFHKLPLMIVILLTTTTLLMFLVFGSVVLPIKAAVMSALTLGSTLGILTWIFVDGHGSSFLNFTPTPLTAPVIGLIIAVVYGLCTDYEVFLVSRMVEARERGMSTTEAIRIGTATTGRLITAAALVLAVVAGAFVFSDLVMMKYLAFGLLFALLLDATVIRMFLVPAVMKMLGDDCWWAPRWMKVLQNKIGMGELHLPDERKHMVDPGPEDDGALVGAGAPGPDRRPPHDPTHPAPEGSARARSEARTRALPEAPSGAGTSRIPSPPSPQSEPDSEAPTTRFSSARNAMRNAVTNAINTGAAATQRQAPPGPPPGPPAGEREIESWLGELRGRPGSPGPQQPPPPPAPSSEPTRAMPPGGRGPSPSDATTAIPVQRPGDDEPATRAIPVSKPQQSDTEAATQKLNAPSEDDTKPPRRGGGLSAADLLRREGRL
ncbi:membrane protein [Mycolicibacterium chitae]|uniref:Putative RND superfamily drug exporter n=2 Tax=Mycolicibacterium chitae TaxID=1792 RepID=A0A3S4SCL9_MYCCI|nr:MMPL family transporter [Mycolicibacterium chitae]BBZ01301.1 membrane protein [Mycolicibacterium chitae]VEG50140.1 putative RND superfamily drug exporter [Mycolicibacterium chitae]